MNEFYVYILTNWNKTVLYTGVTNNLSQRLLEHWSGKEEAFTKRYKAFYLVWYDTSKYILNSISAEKEIKNWTRAKKITLINEFNPEWRFLNADVCGNWPPTDEQMLITRGENN